MTDAILCNGCGVWETVEVFSTDTMKITYGTASYDLCEKCSKIIDKAIDDIPEVEEQ